MKMIMEPDKMNSFVNLTHLVSEMCNFLTSILPMLPENVQDKAKYLIEKSQSNAEKTTYLNMMRCAQGTDNGDYVLSDVTTEDSYECLDNHVQHPPAVEKFPYENMPAQQLQEFATKSGDLLHRERGIFLKKSRKFFVCVVEHWLVFYISCKDMKPHLVININDYVAAQFHTGMNAKDDKQRFRFDVKSPDDTKKVYQFTAKNNKDLIQWILQINKAAMRGCAYNNIPRHLPSDSVEIYYEIGEPLEAPAGTNFERKLPVTPPINASDEELSIYVDVPLKNTHLPHSPLPSPTLSHSDMYDTVGPGVYYSNSVNDEDEERLYADVDLYQTKRPELPVMTMTTFGHKTITTTTTPIPAKEPTVSTVPITLVKPAIPAKPDLKTKGNLLQLVEMFRKSNTAVSPPKEELQDYEEVVAPLSSTNLPLGPPSSFLHNKKFE